jgi:hypothetical protein
MEKELKELLHNPKILYSVALVCCLILSVVCFDLNNAIKYNADLPDPIDFENLNINPGKGISADEFQYNMFVKGIQEDLDKGTSPEAIRLKFKYFYGVELR